MKLRWEESCLYEGRTEYSVELSKSYRFDSLIVSESGVTATELETALPEEGQYFLRVRALGAEGRVQEAYEYYRTESGTTIYGVMCFYVLEDGTVQVSNYIEDE